MNSEQHEPDLDKIRKEALSFGLSDMAAHIAVILADVDGEDRARQYIREICEDRKRLFGGHARPSA